MSAKQAIFLRHGQTDFNTGLRVQGQIDIALNAEGRKQAAAAAVELSKLGISRIISSDLSRCVETAAPVAAALGLEVQTDQRLRERNFGQWEGLFAREIAAGWPEEYARWRRGEDPTGVEVEPRTVLGRRVEAAARAYIEAADEHESILFVSHGSAIGTGVTALLNLDPSRWQSLSGMENCHWAIVRPRFDRPEWNLHGYNLGLPVFENAWQVLDRREK